MWPRAQVTADHGVAAGRDINAGEIIFKYGLTEEEARTLIHELHERDSPTVEKLVELARKLGVTRSALANFFRILGERQVPDERLLEALAEIAERHSAMLDRLAVLDPEGPAVKAQIEEARTAIDAGEYERADRLLSAAEAAERAAVRMADDLAHQAQEAADGRRLNAAATRAERGELSMARLDYVTAAEHFKEAADLAPASALEARARYLNRHAGALQQYGDERGDNAVLRRAIAVYRNTLSELLRGRAPLLWAGIQNNLGNALWTLGEREAGRARLEEAVAAYRAALEEQTRERVPLDWAMTHNNLGIALTVLGKRESGTAHLEEAVAAYQAALEERTRERVPLDWATTQNDLGSALEALGEREPGTARLEEAIAARLAALQVYTRVRAPLRWAGTQNNLGNALRALGEREPDTVLLEEAVTVYHAVLQVWTRERTPLRWAMAHNNLGAALTTLGQRKPDTEHLQEAVAAYWMALHERTRERTPLDWATTKNNLGNALALLGERELGMASSPEVGRTHLEEAVAAYREALQERTRERVPWDWATTQNNLGTALTSLGEHEVRTERLEQAVTAYQAALREWTRERSPLQWAAAKRNLGNTLTVLGKRQRRADLLAEALTAIKEAFEVYRAAGLVHDGDEVYFRTRIEQLEGLIERARYAD